jgi:hypothetical protein
MDLINDTALVVPASGTGRDRVGGSLSVIEGGHREHRMFGDSTYAGVVADRNRFRLCMITQARMLAQWAVECFPASTAGQVHFARAVMESVAQEMLGTLGLPYPFPDSDPGNSKPVSDLVALLKRVEHSLNTVNGVFATDSVSTSGGDVINQWQVDVAADLTEISAMLGRMLGRMRGMGA